MKNNFTYDKFKLSGCYVEITSKCNLKCVHCYNNSGNGCDELTEEDISRMLKGIKNLEDFNLTISGGEPLISSHFWGIVNTCEKLGVGEILVITNATLITFEVAKRIKNLNVRLQISLNGSKSEIHDKICGKNSFEKTCLGIKNLLKLDLEDRIIFRNTINKNNMMDLRDYIVFVSNFGVRNISFGSLKMQGRSITNKNSIYLEHEDYRFAVEELEKLKNKFTDINMDVPELYSFGCPYMFPSDEFEQTDCVPRIDPKGYVYLCQLASGEKYRLGNIKSNSLLDTVKSDGFNEILSELKEIQNNMKQCSKCVWKDYCGRGCIALSIMKNENETDGECDMRKKDFARNLF